MIPNLSLVLKELYHAMYGAYDHGWIGIHTLAGDINEAEGFPYYSTDDTIEALGELEKKKLVEYSKPDFWRISQSFHRDMDEWCERVMETLEAHPEWHGLYSLPRLIAETRHVIVDQAMLGPIMYHLQQKYGDAVEFRIGQVRVSPSEWLRRCQARAHSA